MPALISFPKSFSEHLDSDSPVPIRLARHRPQRSKQEVFPLLVINHILQVRRRAVFRVRAKLLAVAVVPSAQVIDASTALPANDAGVGVFESGHAAVLVDCEEGGAFHALFGVVAEVPHLDFIVEF